MTARHAAFAIGIASIALIATSPPAQAAQVDFNFAGLVLPGTSSGWAGQSVSGTLSVDLDLPCVVPVQGAGIPALDGWVSTGDTPRWLTFSLTNPDGSVLSDTTLGETFVQRAYEVRSHPSRTVQLDISYSESSRGDASAFALSFYNMYGPIRNPGDPATLFIDMTDPYLTAVGHAERGTGIDPVYAYDFRLTAFDRVPAVPEPETWAMLGGGLALLGWLRRRGGGAA